MDAGQNAGRDPGQANIENDFARFRRAMVRQALYTPARVASRFNQDLKTKYDVLINAGRPPKVAITAIAEQYPSTIAARHR